MDRKRAARPSYTLRASGQRVIPGCNTTADPRKTASASQTDRAVPMDSIESNRSDSARAQDIGTKQGRSRSRKSRRSSEVRRRCEVYRWRATSVPETCEVDDPASYAAGSRS
jgi:hypothetical protein